MAAADTGGFSVLIIDRDRTTRDAIQSLCEALGIASIVTSSQPNAVKTYRDNPILVVFLDAEMAQLNARVLALELDRLAADRQRKRPPLVLLYENHDILSNTGLIKLPLSRPMKKPVALAEVYEILAAVGLIGAGPHAKNDGMDAEISAYNTFLAQTEAMLRNMVKDFLEP